MALYDNVYDNVTPCGIFVDQYCTTEITAALFSMTWTLSFVIIIQNDYHKVLQFMIIKGKEV